MAGQKKKLRYSEETLRFPKYYIGWIGIGNCGQKTSTNLAYELWWNVNSQTVTLCHNISDTSLCLERRVVIYVISQQRETCQDKLPPPEFMPNFKCPFAISPQLVIALEFDHLDKIHWIHTDFLLLLESTYFLSSFTYTNSIIECIL